MKQFLTYVNGGPFQYGIAAGLGLPGSTFRRVAADAGGEARPPVRRAGRRRAHRAAVGRDLLRHRRHPLARRDRRHGVLPVAARALRRGRGAERRVLRRQGRRSTRWCGSPCCKRLDVIDDAVDPAAGNGPVRVAAIQHDIVWEDRDANFARLAPKIADAAGDGARLVVLTEMYSTGFSMDTRACCRAVRRSERAVPGRAGTRARGLGVRIGTRGAARRRAPVQHVDPRRARRRGSPVPQDPPVHLRRGARAVRRRRRSTSPSTSKASAAASSSATTCASPTSSGRLAPDTDCYVVVANWPAPGVTTGAPC